MRVLVGRFGRERVTQVFTKQVIQVVQSRLTITIEIFGQVRWTRERIGFRPPIDAGFTQEGHDVGSWVDRITVAVLVGIQKQVGHHAAGMITVRFFDPTVQPFASRFVLQFVAHTR